jgi:hypothetical protein
VGVAGGEPQTLAETNGLGGASWSHDGVILLSPSLGGESPLFRVPANGGALTPVTTLDPAHGETNNVWPQFLPDGRHFLYNIMARDNPGIYVGSLGSADRTQLLAFNLKDPDDVGLSTLAFAPPRYMLYVRGQTLMAQPLDLKTFTLDGAAVPIAYGVEKVGPGSAAFSVSEGGILAYMGGTGVEQSQLTWRARDGTASGRIGTPAGYGAGPTFEIGAATPLFKISGTAYAPSGDGKRFVTNDPVGNSNPAPITVVVNWLAGLGK